MPGVADHVLWPIGWVLWLQLAAWRVGRSVTSRVLPETAAAGPGVRPVIDGAVGLAVLAHVALLLGAAGVLHRELLLVGGGLLGLWGLLTLVRSRRVGRVRLRWQDAPFLAAVLFFATFLPAAVDPFLAHDDNVYHVQLPKTYLQQHAIVALPANLYANMPHLVEVLYTWPLASWDVSAPKLAAFTAHFWILAGLAAAAAPHAGRFGAGLIALAYVSGKNVQWHTETAYVEPVFGLFLLGALLAFVAWHESRHAGWLTLVGLLGGAAFASKYTGWLFGSALLLPMALAVWRSPARARSGAAIRLIGIPAAMVLPWLVKNAAITGNPIYPNLYGWLGGRFWSDVQQFHYLRSQSYAGGDAGYLESLPWIPVNLTLRDSFFYCPSFSIALMVLFLAAMVVSSAWRPPARYVLGMAGLGLLAWAFSARQGRFLVAWVPVMAVAASFALAPIRRNAAALAGLAGLVLLAGVWQLRAQLHPYEPPVRMLGAAREAAILRNFNYELCLFLNSAVPPDAKVLALWDNRLFFLDREFYADSAYEAPTGLAWLRSSPGVEPFIEELRRHRVTHVIVHGRVMNSYLRNALAFDLTDSLHYPAERLAADRALVDGLLAALEPVHRIGAVDIYRIR